MKLMGSLKPFILSDLMNLAVLHQDIMEMPGNRSSLMDTFNT